MIKERAAKTDEAAIRNLMDAIVKALNNRNFETLLSMHSDDVILMEPDTPLIQGKEKVRQLFNHFKKERTSVQLRLLIQELEVTGIRAFARGQIFSTITKIGQAPEEGVGKFICLFKKGANGDWLRTHIIVNRDAPVHTNLFEKLEQ